MSLLGKILLFVNLLAAAGLVYLAAQDWGKRQQINGTVLRYQMALDGISVDPLGPDEASEKTVPVTVATPAGRTTTTVPRKLLDDHFQGTGAGAPASQVDEVKAAWTKLLAEIDGAGNDAAARTLAVGKLLSLAGSFEERTAARRLATLPDARAAREEAVARLKRKFDAVIAAPNPAGFAAESAALDEVKQKLQANPNNAQAKGELERLMSYTEPPFARDEADRRRRIAHLLMLLDPTANHQKRVMLLAGLPTYLSALGGQTANLEEMVRRTERAIERDQAAFEVEYETLKRLAIEQDQLVLQQQRVVKGLQDQLAADAAAAKTRDGQLAALDQQLAALSGEVSDLLAKQAQVEKALFEVQKRVGDTMRGNGRLEADLGRAERVGGK